MYHYNYHSNIIPCSHTLYLRDLYRFHTALHVCPYAALIFFFYIREEFCLLRGTNLTSNYTCSLHLFQLLTVSNNLKTAAYSYIVTLHFLLAFNISAKCGVFSWYNGNRSKNNKKNFLNSDVTLKKPETTLIYEKTDRARHRTVYVESNSVIIF
jgi:hypothetical protein